MVEIKTIIIGILRVNCYLLYDSNKQAIVIDPGAKSEELAKLIQNKDLKVRQILLTHGHFDHFNGVAWLKRLTSSKVAMSQEDVPIIKEFSGFRAKFYGYQVEPFKPDIFLKEGDIVKVGEIELKVIKSPGHSIGGLSFYFKKNKILFTGDTIFKGSVGRIDLPSSSLKDLQQTLKKIRQLPKETKIYPGHGPFSTLGDEMKMIEGILTPPPARNGARHGDC